MCQQFQLSCLSAWLLLCRWVDEIVTDAPWVITPEFIEKHKIDYVTHDALPYSDASGQADDVYEFVSNCGCAISFITAAPISRHDFSCHSLSAGQEGWQIYGNKEDGGHLNLRHYTSHRQELQRLCPAQSGQRILPQGTWVEPCPGNSSYACSQMNDYPRLLCSFLQLHGRPNMVFSLQEKQIRARQSLKQFSDLMLNQRLHVADKVKKSMVQQNIIPTVGCWC